MATSMNYSVVARKNPSKKSEPAKYYALAQASGELDFDEMCEAITGRTTCTETDVRARSTVVTAEIERARIRTVVVAAPASEPRVGGIGCIRIITIP